jgi:hypothetical protein
MVEAMIKYMGVVTTAARSIDIPRSTYYDWMETDPAFKQRILDLREIKKDFVESKLLKLVEDGDTAATIFSAKTLLKDRGYVERQEVTPVDSDGNSIQPIININVIRTKKEIDDSL